VTKFRAIAADTVAAAMIGAALEGVDGTRALHYDEMVRLGTDAGRLEAQGSRLK